MEEEEDEAEEVGVWLLEERWRCVDGVEPVGRNCCGRRRSGRRLAGRASILEGVRRRIVILKVRMMVTAVGRGNFCCIR